MSGRLLITSAFMLLFAGPAFADCNQEIQRPQWGGDPGGDRCEQRRHRAPRDARIRSRCSPASSRARPGRLAKAQPVRLMSLHRPISSRCSPRDRLVSSPPISSPKHARWPRPVTRKDACRK